MTGLSRLDILSSNPKRAWTRERILQAFRELFVQWKQDATIGALAGKAWGQKYVTDAGGRNLLRAIAYVPLTPEIFLRQIGGEIFTAWTRRWHVWDPEREREELQRAHTQWRTDTLVGRWAGKPFNVYWLERNGYHARVATIGRHFSGGVQAFARTIPDVYCDWSFRPRRVSTAEIRRRIRHFFRGWQRDPRGRLGGVQFGPMYLRQIGERGLPTLIDRRGRKKVFSGSGMFPVRRAWGRRISKSKGGP